MADIISLQQCIESIRKNRHTSGNEPTRHSLPADWSAQIIIFPGIRIERDEDYVSSGCSVK